MKTARIAPLPAVALGLVLAGCAGAPPQAAAPAAAPPGQPMQQYEAAVNRIIADHFQYPARALRESEAGVTVVQVQVARDGTVLGEKLLQKSGFALLDSESLELFERIHRFPPMPADFYPGTETFTFTLPIYYSVSGGAAPNGGPLSGGAPDGKWSPSWR